MADSNKRFTGDSDFERRNSHDPVNPLAAVEGSVSQPERAGTPPDGGQDVPLLKKKPTSFQITSVTVQGSRLSTDGGDDSADDLDESHTEDLSSDVLDISRTTDLDNDPLSEENSNNAAGDAVKSIPVKQAPESQPPKLDTPTAESDAPSSNMQSVPTVLPTSATPDVISNTKSTEPTNESATKAPTIPDQWQHRFKVVKIVSSQPYKRGRWLCMDFMDPPSAQSSEAKSEVPPEAMTNVTVGSGSHAETVMCGTQTTNNVAHVYEIPPNESYPGSISVTVCPQPIQQPFYGIFLPLNNSQMPDMSAMPSGFAQDSTRKFESSVPSMQPITVGFINQPSQFPHMGSSMQQAHSFVGGNNKSYDKGSTQSQSYVPQQQQQPQPASQSFVPQSQQQQSHVTQSQSFTSQPPQTTQTQSFIQQPTPQIMSSAPQVMSSAPQVMSSATSVQSQSISHAGVQQPPTTHSVTETPTMQVTQGGSSAAPLTMSVPQQASSMEQIVSMQQPATGVAPPTAYNSQNLTQASGASESIPMTAMSSVVQTMPTTTTVVSGNNIPPANVPPSIPDNLISSNMQQTSKEIHNVPSQLHYNHVDARENTQSSVTQPVAESLPEVSASKAPTEETESAPSGSNTVAIDNKIEQAMDLVKSHLMFAVREEVDVLKEKITELVERISLLEYENTFLKANASQETLSQLNQSQQLHQQQQQQQQQQQTQNAAVTQGQQNLQSQQPTL